MTIQEEFWIVDLHTLHGSSWIDDICICYVAKALEIENPLLELWFWYLNCPNSKNMK